MQKLTGLGFCGTLSNGYKFLPFQEVFLCNVTKLTFHPEMELLSAPLQTRLVMWLTPMSRKWRSNMSSRVYASGDCAAFARLVLGPCDHHTVGEPRVKDYLQIEAQLSNCCNWAQFTADPTAKCNHMSELRQNQQRTIHSSHKIVRNNTSLLVQATLLQFAMQ